MIKLNFCLKNLGAHFITKHTTVPPTPNLSTRELSFKPISRRERPFVNQTSILSSWKTPTQLSMTGHEMCLILINQL